MIATFIPPEKLGTPKMSDSPWELLPTASNHAASLDGLYVLLTIVSAVAFVLVIGTMIYFMWKYRKRSDNDKTSPLKSYYPNVMVRHSEYSEGGEGARGL